MSIDVADASGLPVLTVRSLMTRPMTGEQLHAAVTRQRRAPIANRSKWCGLGCR